MNSILSFCSIGIGKALRLRTLGLSDAAALGNLDRSCFDWIKLT
jgi:hypothetical protein